MLIPQLAASIIAITGLIDVVADHGAAGDGVADDTTEIQAALTAAVTAKSAVWFPRGIYRITSGLTAYIGGGGANSTLRIAGAPGAIIRAGAAIPIMLDVRNGSFVTIADLELDCNAAADTGLYTLNVLSRAAVVERVTVHHCLGAGIVVDAGQAATWHHVVSRDNAGVGIDIDDSNNMALLGVIAERNGGHGIAIDATAASGWMFVRDSITRNNTGHGLLFRDGVFGGVVVGLSSTDNADDEIEINGRGVIVSDSFVRHTGSANAVYINPSIPATQYGGNRIVDNTIYGTVTGNGSTDAISNPARAFRQRTPQILPARQDQSAMLDAVADYGLSTSGDQSVTLAGAIAGAIAQDRILYVPHGTYSHASIIDIAPTAGQRVRIVSDHARFQSTSPMAIGWRIRGAGTTELTRLQINANSQATVALEVSASGPVRLTNVAAYTALGDCLTMSGSGPITAERISAGPCGDDGIVIDQSAASGLITIDGCAVGSATGIAIAASGNGAARGAQIWGCDVAGSGAGLQSSQRRADIRYSWVESNAGDDCIQASGQDSFVGYSRLCVPGGASSRSVRLPSGSARMTVRGNTAFCGTAPTNRAIHDQAMASPAATYNQYNAYDYAVQVRVMSTVQTQSVACPANTVCWQSMP